MSLFKAKRYFFKQALFLIEKIFAQILGKHIYTKKIDLLTIIKIYLYIYYNRRSGYAYFTSPFGEGY